MFYAAPELLFLYGFFYQCLLCRLLSLKKLRVRIMPLSTNQRKDLIRCYHQSGNSLTGALRQYRREKKLRKGPCSNQALGKLIKKFEATGSVLDKKSSGRPSVSENEVIGVLNEITEMSKENPYNISSAHGVANRLNMPYSTVRKILRQTLKFYPYRIRRVHELMPNDMNTRLDFALKCVAEIESNDQWLSNILWSD